MGQFIVPNHNEVLEDLRSMFQISLLMYISVRSLVSITQILALHQLQAALRQNIRFSALEVKQSNAQISKCIKVRAPIKHPF